MYPLRNREDSLGAGKCSDWPVPIVWNFLRPFFEDSTSATRYKNPVHPLFVLESCDPVLLCQSG